MFHVSGVITEERERERGGGQVGCCQSLFFLQGTTPLYLLSQNRNKANHATDVTSKQEMSPEHAYIFFFFALVQNFCKPTGKAESKSNN